MYFEEIEHKYLASSFKFSGLKGLPENSQFENPISYVTLVFVNSVNPKMYCHYLIPLPIDKISSFSRNTLANDGEIFKSTEGVSFYTESLTTAKSRVESGILNIFDEALEQLKYKTPFLFYGDCFHSGNLEIQAPSINEATTFFTFLFKMFKIIFSPPKKGKAPLPICSNGRCGFSTHPQNGVGFDPFFFAGLFIEHTNDLRNNCLLINESESERCVELFEMQDLQIVQ